MAGARTSGRRKDYTIDAKLEQLWSKGYSLQEIANMTGKTVAAIRQRMNLIGIRSDREITKNWLKTSGIGKQWDDTRLAIRKACGL